MTVQGVIAVNKSMEYIYQIYKEGGFSQAAQKLYVSQPAISSIVRRTEQQLGVPLFDRSTSPVRPTEDGLYYIQCIERIRAIEDEMAQYFEQRTRCDHGTLSIGSGTYYCTYLLPGMIRDFHALHPGIQISQLESSSVQRLPMLLQGELDFSLDVNIIEEPTLKSVPVARENILLAVPSSFPCNDKLRYYRLTMADIRRGVHLDEQFPVVDISAFRDEPFVLMKPGNHSHDMLQELCRLGGFDPKVVISTDQMLTAYYIACEGAGITIVRDTSLRHVALSSNLCYYRLPKGLDSRDIFLTYLKRAEDKPIIRLFLDYVNSQINRYHNA